MTKPHKDRIEVNGQDHGYSIRVGKRVPANSANLAYVHTPKISPKNNLFITDLTHQIQENAYGADMVLHKTVYPDKDFLLRELSGNYRFPTSDIAVTDEFSVPSTREERPIPLYYQAELKGWFDAAGSLVYDYMGGYIPTPIEKPKYYSEYPFPKPTELLYLGGKIQITKLDGTPIESNKKFKVKLVQQEGEGVPANAYRIVIYTNFRGDEDETYLVRYEKYNEDGRHIADYTEVLNAYPYFKKVSREEVQALADSPKEGNAWKPALDDKIYAIEETNHGDFLVYAPSRVIVADQGNARPAEQFRYRVTANLTNRFSNQNPGTLRVGVAYLNNAIPNVESLIGVMKKLNESPWKPEYLSLENPHPPEGYPTKDLAHYWMVDLSMHPDLLEDYDLILITGYGTIDMTDYTDSLRKYLESGGKIWIDNPASGTNALKLANFLTNITFSTKESVDNIKGKGVINNEWVSYLDRLYVMNGDILPIGYPGVNAKILFGSGEAPAGWTSIIRYGDNQHSVMFRSAFDKGQIIVSNCGLSLAVLHEDTSGSLNTKFVMNILLTAAERRWVVTPWIQDHVYHRDNLFKEEYTQGTKQMYFDDKNDLNPNEVVAKKLISKTVHDTLLPYIPSYYENASGTYKVEVHSDSEQIMTNSDFEVGSNKTQWVVTTLDAISGWNVVIVGDGYAEHVANVVQRGTKAIKVAGPTSGNGAQIFWNTKKTLTEPGTYEFSGWIKTLNATSANLSVYAGGVKIATSPPVTGTQDWVKVSVTFSIMEQKEIEFRVGFTDQKSLGTAWCDQVSLYKKGNVYMTPENNGRSPLYAFTTKPSRNGFNFRSEGFQYSDITVYDRYVEAIVKIRPFVYAWDNLKNRYVKKYDDSTSGRKIRIRKSQGYVSLGLVSELLPELKQGAEWADKNKVFFELTVEPANESDSEIGKDNKDYLFVNAGFFNTKTGRYCRIKEGKHVVAYTDLFREDDPKSKSNYIVQVWTDYYTVRATKRRFSILVDTKNRIELAYPSTIDERDNWYLRIKNGRFTVRQMDYYRYIQYYRGRPYYVHKAYWNPSIYSLPEYYRQAFSPTDGFKRVQEELCEYVNERTIRLQNAPLYVKRGDYKRDPAKKLIDSNYSDGRSRFYKIPANQISKDKPVEVYIKEKTSLDFIRLIDDFDIDYENGLVILERGIDAEVEVSYSCDNLQIFKRTYQNKNITEEMLQTSDNKTFTSSRKNWMSSPVPKIYVKGNGGRDIQLIPNDAYEIDYEQGSITFYEETAGPIYASFTYSVNQPLKIRDYDIQNGFIYLEDTISFKDDIYANYYYEEQYLEYRGYYDEEAKRFIHLDLNPSEGHYCTIPSVKYDSRLGKIVTFEDVPTARLLNKEIYIYLLPHKHGDQIEEHCVRHCLSKQEWGHVEKTNPMALLLGVVHIREHAKVEDVVVMDARVRGGGLRTNITKQEIQKKSPISENYWDIGPFDGMAYTSNGVVIIQLPKSILKREGGQFTEKEVNDMVKKYIAYGIYYEIEYV